MGVGRKCEGKRSLLQTVVRVINDDPKTVFVTLIFGDVFLNSFGTESITHIGRWVNSINTENIGEVNCLPLFDPLLELELKFEGIIAFEFADPHFGEGDCISIETP